MKILVVDDDFGIRLMLCDALRREHDMFEASNGKEGAQICFERNPDLVITDMMMPMMNGDKMIAAIRKRRPWVKFIAMSASIEWDLPPDVKLVSKPFHISNIKELIC